MSQTAAAPSESPLPLREGVGGGVSRRTALRPYILIAPSLIFLLLLFFVPLVQTIALAFRTSAGAGFGNFAKMAGTTSISSTP